MSKLAKVIGKNGILTAVAIDLLGILVSFLVDTNITNAMLAKLVFLTYCVRFELICILLVLCLAYFCGYIYAKYPDSRREKLWTLFGSLVLGLCISASPLLHYAKARYFYFNRQLYQYEAQKKYLNDAIAHYRNEQWDECLKDLNMAQAFYSDNKFTNKLADRMKENITFVHDYSNNLFELYIRPSRSVITYESFHCAHTLSKLYPQKYQLIFDDYFARLMDAELAYSDLYKAVQKDDYSTCHSLIMEHGWFWFEPTLNARFSYDNEKYIMPLLHQYVDNEDMNDGIERLEKYWLGENGKQIFATNFEVYAEDK